MSAQTRNSASASPLGPGSTARSDMRTVSARHVRSPTLPLLTTCWSSPSDSNVDSRGAPGSQRAAAQEVCAECLRKRENGHARPARVPSITAPGVTVTAYLDELAIDGWMLGTALRKHATLTDVCIQGLHATSAPRPKSAEYPR